MGSKCACALLFPPRFFAIEVVFFSIGSVVAEMSKDIVQVHKVVATEDKENDSSTEPSEPPTKIFKPDTDPNTAVSSTDNNTEVTNKSPVQPSKKPRPKLSEAEKVKKKLPYY
jgi:hypothetical protein